jgi:hypothetical protein
MRVSRIILIAALLGAVTTLFFGARSDGMVVKKKQRLEQQTNKPTSVETPSDANNANLKDTLDWLKKQIAKYAAQTRSPAGDVMTLEFAKFNSCHVEWHLNAHPGSLDAPGRVRTFPLNSMYYSTELKDMDPESVQVTESGDSLRFYARDRKERITLNYVDENTGRANPFMIRQLPLASFELKKNTLGTELKEALSHAIKLCQ